MSPAVHSLTTFSAGTDTACNFVHFYLATLSGRSVDQVVPGRAVGWPLQQPLCRSVASPSFANVHLAKPTSASEGTSVAPPESQPQSFIDYVYYIEEGSESPLSRSGNLRPFAESLLAAHLEHYLELEDKFGKYFRPNMRLCEGLVAVGIAPTLNLAREKCVDFGRRIAEKSAADNAPLLFQHPSPVGGEASISCNVQRVGQSLERDKTGGTARSRQEIYCPAASVMQDKSLIEEMVNKSTYIGSRRLLLTENRGRIISLPLEAVEERMTAAASLSSTHHVKGGRSMADSASTHPNSCETIVDPTPSTSEDSISSSSLLKEHEPPFLKHRNPCGRSARQTSTSASSHMTQLVPAPTSISLPTPGESINDSLHHHYFDEKAPLYEVFIQHQKSLISCYKITNFSDTKYSEMLFAMRAMSSPCDTGRVRNTQDRARQYTPRQGVG